MHKERRKSATVHLAAAVLLTCCLIQTTDSYRLKKTEKRHDADAATRIDVQEGTIVFGKAFQIGSDLESYIIDGTRKATSNDSVGDETSYQSDAGWPFGGPIFHPKEAEFKHFAPTLQCLKDHLKFRVVGPTAAHFTLDGVPPVPLSHIPPSCGYNVQKNSVALVVQTPYNGCNVYKKGEHVVLPLRWQGYPVTLVCPKPAYSTPTPHYNVPAHPASHPNVKFPPFYFFPPYPKYPVVLPEHPHKPELPKYPLHHLPPPYYYYYLPRPPKTPSPSTASVHNFAHSHLFPFHLYPNVPPYYWYGPQTVVDHTVTTKPQVHHIPVLPQYPPFLHPQYPKYPVPDKPTLKPPVHPPHGHPHHPSHEHPPHGHPHHPPHDHPPHGHPHHPPHEHPPHGHPHHPPHDLAHFPHPPPGNKHPSHGDHQVARFPHH